MQKQLCMCLSLRAASRVGALQARVTKAGYLSSTALVGHTDLTMNVDRAIAGLRLLSVTFQVTYYIVATHAIQSALK